MDVTLAVLAEDVARANGALVAGALTRIGAMKGVELVVTVVELDESTSFADAARALALAPTGVLLFASDAVPSSLPEGIVLGATPRREDTRDALCGSDLASLGAGSTVLTNSPARVAQLRRLVPGVDAHVVTGARPQLLIAQVGDEAQAAMVDVASVRRLGLVDRIGYVFDPADVWPCPCQAAAEIFVSAEAPDDLATVVRSLNHEATRLALAAERAVAQLLAPGLDNALSVQAHVTGARVEIEARITSRSGALQLTERCDVELQDLEAGARGVAYGLLGRGAASIASL